MKLHQKLKELIAKLKALGEKSEWTEADEAEETEIKSAIAETKAAIERDNKRKNVGATVAENESFLNDPVTDLPHAAEGEAVEGKAGDSKTKESQIEFKRSRVKNFKSAKSAYGMGMFMLAGLYNDSKAAKYCKDNGIAVKVHVEGRNDRGGILVPEQFDDELIDLREDYGVARRLLKNKVMTGDTLKRKRRVSGLTAYPVGERGAATESMKNWDEVTLNAKRWAVLTRMSGELSEDSIINEADDFAGEMGYAFAQKEDDCAFNGDGTSAYHKIVGLSTRLKALSGTIANIAGLQVASGNGWDEIVKGDFTKLLAKAPTYVFNRKPRWFCSSPFYYSVIERILDEAGGNTRTELINGRAMNLFKGFPIEFVQSMPTIEANSTIPLYFGVPELAGDFGDRRGITITNSTEATIGGESLYEQGEEAMMATERFDINWHDVGNAHATAGSRVSGPMVGLIMAAA